MTATRNEKTYAHTFAVRYITRDYFHVVHLFHILSCHHSHPYLIYLLLLTVRRSAKDKQHQPNTSCCP